MTPEFESTPFSPHLVRPVHEYVSRRPAGIDEKLRPAFIAYGVGVHNLEKLFQAGARCVTTGQQPGLLTGPLFTIYKALTLLALARRLEAESGESVVPAFWVSGDDHDFAEANHFDLLNLKKEVERVCLRERETSAPLTPLYKEPVGHEISRVFARLLDQTPETEFRDEVFDWLERHYRPDNTLAHAFAHCLADLLGKFGLVVFDPTAHEAKQKMAPLLIKALEEPARLTRALTERAESLRAEGEDVPVDILDGASLVMVEAAMGRDRLLYKGDRYEARRSGESWTLGELVEMSQKEPGRLSPNVLLRPVIEAALLPTVAYVAGPSELSYLPQCKPIYEAFEIPPPVPVARWSARVVEARVGKVLDKFGVIAQELSDSAGRIEAALMMNEIPKAARAALDALKERITEEYGRLVDAATEVDPTLDRSVESARNAALAGVTDVEKRLITHLKQKNDVVVQQIRKARNSLFPNGRPQERALNVVQFITRYGDAFVDEAFKACENWVADLEPAQPKP